MAGNPPLQRTTMYYICITMSLITLIRDFSSCPAYVPGNSVFPLQRIVISSMKNHFADQHSNNQSDLSKKDLLILGLCMIQLGLWYLFTSLLCALLLCPI